MFLIYHSGSGIPCIEKGDTNHESEKDWHDFPIDARIDSDCDIPELKQRTALAVAGAVLALANKQLTPRPEHMIHG